MDFLRPDVSVARHAANAAKGILRLRSRAEQPITP